ncbi:MAG: hypothetical protein C0467_28865 [Planctomycetaceae bacterium]|nr:hypothetical protein [Planctomycetaceae bacterium]
MNIPIWCADLADGFWARVGTTPAYPRDLRKVIAAAVPLSVIDLPSVTVTAVRQWFEWMNLPIHLDEADRPLRACLVALCGEGFAFVDAYDTDMERNFSIAHELGHFLRDYFNPRETVIQRLGSVALEVLDGKRPPTPTERFQAVFRNAPIGPFTHVLRRDETGIPLTHVERESEFAADRLAFELLAPVAALGDCENRNELVTRLVDVFGLPPEPATRYANLLLPDAPKAGVHVSRFLIC